MQRNWLADSRNTLRTSVTSLCHAVSASEEKRPFTSEQPGLLNFEKLALLHAGCINKLVAVLEI